jgi:Sulfotransferase family
MIAARTIRRFLAGISGRAPSNMSSILTEPVYPEPEEIVRNGETLFHAERLEELQDSIQSKVEALGRYDVRGMERVAAITFWGRSGSILLASFLDGHDDVLMLPANRSDGLYKFFDLYKALTLYQKLIAYPAFVEIYDATSDGAGCGRSFFAGAFGISASEYFAAVHAICQAHSELPAEFLMSRRAFFLFVHIAYSIALGRRPTTSRPLVICSQHEWNDTRAAHFVEDFPHAKFIHTVRDPISAFDRLFGWWFDAHLLPREPPAARATAVLEPARNISILAPWTVVRALVDADRAHSGMEAQTVAIRFEDLHCGTAATMRELSAWLGLSYQPSLLRSTFNGLPYIVVRDGQSWSGPRPANVGRHLGNTWKKDRMMLYAIFNENFRAWRYPCPKIIGVPIVRCLVVLLFPFLPMKTEIIVARAAFRYRVLPSLRRRQWAILGHSLLRILFCRLAITWLLLREGVRRLIHQKTLLQVCRNHPDTAA